MTTAHLQEQTRVTRALLKFCRDHKRSDASTNAIEHCLVSLEAKDIATALDWFQQVPLGGNGCFNDWFPPMAFPHETDEYVWTVFEALVTNWSLMMRLSIPKGLPNATVA